MEVDNEVSGNGNSYTTEFRQYDPRLGRWKSLDPLKAKYPMMSPYVAFNNNPILYVDPNGLEGQDWVRGGTKSDGTQADAGEWHWRDDVKSLKEAEAIGGTKFTDGISDNTYSATSSDGKAITVTLGPGGHTDWTWSYDDPKDAALETDLDKITEMGMQMDQYELDTYEHGEITEPGKKAMLQDPSGEFDEFSDNWDPQSNKRFAEVVGTIAEGALGAASILSGTVIVKNIATSSSRGGVQEPSTQPSYSESTYNSFLRQFREHGRNSLLKSQRKIQRRLTEHLDKLREINRNGGHGSSVEREISTFEKQLEAIKDVLKNNP